MELIKLDKTNQSQVSEFVKLRRNHNRFNYPLLASPEEEYFKLHLSATERPTHYFVYYLVKEKDDIIGYLSLLYHKLRDTHMIGLDYFVDEDFQSIDTYRFLLKEIEPQILDHITVIGAGNIIPSGSTDKFGELTVLGDISQYLVYTERINVSALNSFHALDIKEKVEQFTTELHDKKFEFLVVENGQFHSESKLNYDKFLTAVVSIWNDMPIEDADWSDEVISPEIHKAIFQNIKELGGSHCSIILIHKETGDIAGYTDIYYYPTQPEIIHQGDTGVISTFRGNGFGRMLKYKMLLYILQREEYKNAIYWVTGNANSNKHMLAINDELGYKHTYSELWYDIPRQEFRKLLSE